MVMDSPHDLSVTRLAQIKCKYIELCLDFGFPNFNRFELLTVHVDFMNFQCIILFTFTSLVNFVVLFH